MAAQIKEKVLQTIRFCLNYLFSLVIRLFFFASISFDKVLFKCGTKKRFKFTRRI